MGWPSVVMLGPNGGFVIAALVTCGVLVMGFASALWRVVPDAPRVRAAVHGLPPELSLVLAIQETNGACTVVRLAAVDEGLATYLHSIAAPERQQEVKGLLRIPERFAPVWLQLVGYPAESPAAGGQRIRGGFEELYALQARRRPRQHLRPRHRPTRVPGAVGAAVAGRADGAQRRAQP